MAETCCLEFLGRGYGIKEGSGQVLERFSRRSLAVAAAWHYSCRGGICLIPGVEILQSKKLSQIQTPSHVINGRISDG
jgi:hypothetical protein